MYAITTLKRHGLADMFENTGRFTDRCNNDEYSCHQNHFRIGGRVVNLDSDRFKFHTVLMHQRKLLWVPRLLTAEPKEKKFAISLDFLIRYEEEGYDRLGRIVTGDDTWVSHITPESKQQTMEWRHTSSPVKVKSKQTLSKRKILATVF
ncbi:histone-lysine N-methyltransferase SETMAR [Trichonephila clavipes]|nr:histone-lysine N-methyltransferase SETMAR [Trichonephila clavipes]